MIRLEFPAWYKRYAEWSHSKGAAGTLVSVFVGATFGVVLANLLLSSFGGSWLTSVIGWALLVGGPVVALDAWAAGILMEQKVAPWVRLFAISGVGVVGDLFVLLNF